MTISIKSFELKREQEKILSYWNNDGSMRVFVRSNKADDKDDGTSVKLTPALLHKIIILAEEAKQDGKFFDSDIVPLPGLFGPEPTRLLVSKEGPRVSIIAFTGRHPSQLHQEPPMSILLEDLKSVLNSSIDTRAEFFKTCGIQPLIGAIIKDDPTKKV